MEEAKKGQPNSENQNISPLNVSPSSEVENIAMQNFIPHNFKKDSEKSLNIKNEEKFNRFEISNQNQNFNQNFYLHINQNFPQMNSQDFPLLSYMEYLTQNSTLLPKPYIIHDFYERQSNNMFQEQVYDENYNKENKQSRKETINFNEIA